MSLTSIAERHKVCIVTSIATMKNGEDTVMGQEAGLFGADETSAVFATLTEVGAREETESETLSDEQCDGALTEGDKRDRVEEALDALAYVNAGADGLMRVAADLLGKLDDNRAIAVVLERSCRLQSEDLGTLSRQHLLVLFNRVESCKAEISAALARKREAETALHQALGPCSGAYEAAE